MPLICFILLIMALSVFFYYVIFYLPKKREIQRRIRHNEYLKRRDILLKEHERFIDCYIESFILE